MKMEFSYRKCYIWEQKKVDIGCKWAWLTVTRIIIKRSARYFKQEIMINSTFCFTKKCHPDADASCWKFCLYPTRSPPLSPWTDNDHAANQTRNTSKFRQCKSYWNCCPFNWLETRKVWYITQRPRLIVKAKDSQISGIELRSCLG